MLEGRTQTYLRRATSTTYYALFHAIANCCADTFVGPTGHRNNRQAWQRAYRALDHGYAKSQCQGVRTQDLPVAIVDFARAFVAMQAKRHEADYDPYGKFYKSECLADIEDARRLIEAFERAPRIKRRAFAAFVLLRSR